MPKFVYASYHQQYQHQNHKLFTKYPLCNISERRPGRVFTLWKSLSAMVTAVLCVRYREMMGSCAMTTSFFTGLFVFLFFFISCLFLSGRSFPQKMGGMLYVLIQRAH